MGVIMIRSIEQVGCHIAFTSEGLLEILSKPGGYGVRLYPHEIEKLKEFLNSK